MTTPLLQTYDGPDSPHGCCALYAENGDYKAGRIGHTALINPLKAAFLGYTTGTCFYPQMPDSSMKHLSLSCYGRPSPFSSPLNGSSRNP